MLVYEIIGLFLCSLPQHIAFLYPSAASASLPHHQSPEKKKKNPTRRAKNFTQTTSAASFSNPRTPKNALCGKEQIYVTRRLCVGAVASFHRAENVKGENIDPKSFQRGDHAGSASRMVCGCAKVMLVERKTIWKVSEVWRLAERDGSPGLSPSFYIPPRINKKSFWEFSIPADPPHTPTKGDTFGLLELF